MPVHVIAARIYTGRLLYLGKTDGVLGSWHVSVGSAEQFKDVLEASRTHDSVAAFLQEPYVKSGFSLKTWAELYAKARVVELGLGEVNQDSFIFNRSKLVTLAHSADPNERHRFVRLSFA